MKRVVPTGIITLVFVAHLCAGQSELPAIGTPGVSCWVSASDGELTAAVLGLRIPAFVGKLSESWQRYLTTPFVLDTLVPLIGREPLLMSSRSRPPLGFEDYRGGLTTRGEVRLFQSPNDDLLTHELGHVIAHRLLAPQVTDSLQTIFERLRPRAFLAYYSTTGDYAGEYVAETFRMTMTLVRSGSDEEQALKLQKLERDFPGISMWYNWVRSRLRQQDIVARP